MLVIWGHAICATAAVFLGIWQLAQSKGTINHRRVGWLWVMLMVFVALSSFWIQELNPDGTMSIIHLLSVITLASLVIAIIAIHNKNINAHQCCMIGCFVGLCVAGVFTFLPGRLLSTVAVKLLSF